MEGGVSAAVAAPAIAAPYSEPIIGRLDFAPETPGAGEVAVGIVYQMDRYGTLASLVALYPLFVTIGLNAFGEVEGIRGSWLAPVFAYLDVGV